MVRSHNRARGSKYMYFNTVCALPCASHYFIVVEGPLVLFSGATGGLALSVHLDPVP